VSGGTVTLGGAAELAGTVEVSGGTLTTSGAIEVAADTGTLTVSGGTVNLNGAANLAGTVTVSGGALTTSGDNNTTVSGTFTVDDGTVTLGGTTTVLGALTVEAGTVTVSGGLTVEGSGTLTANSDVTVDGTLATDGGTVTGSGKLEGEGSVSGDKISVVVETEDTTGLKSFPASTVEGLAAAIASAKEVEGGEGVVLLTEAFYEDAEDETTAIVIDPDTDDNGDHYTIRGLGGPEAEDDVPALKVGILLANDNVTLEEVRFNITDLAKGAPTGWQQYKAGVSIIRYSDSTTPLTNENLVSKDVTVKDCSITFNGTGQFAGIYIGGSGGGQTHYTPEDITITGNAISVTGSTSAAIQAIAVRRYDPTMVITNNVLTSANATRPTNYWDVPAGALFMQIDPSTTDLESTNIAQTISGNTLEGIFDFYVNIYSTGTNAGIPKLFENRFGTVQTTWATGSTTDKDPGTFYKKLFDSLLSQVKDKTGFGYFQMTFGTAGTTPDNKAAREQYDINDGKVTAIDFWGPKGVGSLTEESTGYNITNDTNTGTTGTAAGGTRDRITVNPTTGVPDPTSISEQYFHSYKDDDVETGDTDFAEGA
jgi:hypothetical protein